MCLVFLFLFEAMQITNDMHIYRRWTRLIKSKQLLVWNGGGTVESMNRIWTCFGLVLSQYI